MLIIVSGFLNASENHYNSHMKNSDHLLDLFTAWGMPIGITGVSLILAIWLIHRVLPKKTDFIIYKQLGVITLVVISMVILVVLFPLAAETQAQLLSLFGLVITAVIALASTTFVSNAMAGFMLRSVSGFTVGDFIRLEQHFGRVTEQSMLHTEIQTEDRDLVTLPNLFVISHPVTVVRRSGTLISADVSLGYDIYRRTISELLKAAAGDAELVEPFVQIIELGDYSVTYRVSGFLEDVQNLVSKRTQLKAKMLDRLHDANIEMVSPAFMNQRPISSTKPFIPAKIRPENAEEEDGKAEQMMFDKAELAERKVKFVDQKNKLEIEIEELKKEDDPPQMEIGWRKKQIVSLDEIIQSLELDE